MEVFWVFGFGSRPLVNVLYTPGENGQGCRKFPLGIVAIGDAQETLLVLDKTDDLNTTFFLDFFPLNNLHHRSR